MPTLRIRIILPLLLVAALAGCSQQGGPASSNVTGPGGSTGSAAEQAEVAATLSDAPQYVEDGLMEDPSQMDFSSVAAPSGGVTAMIRPVRFWRNIQRVERNFEFAFADTDSTGRPTTALVTIHKHLFGTFNILAGDPVEAGVTTDGPTPRDTTLHLVQKPLADHWVRRVLLKRVPPPPPGDGDVANVSSDVGDSRPRWRIAATSGVDVTSRSATTRILSLRVQAGPLDTTITDPLALFRLRQVMRFPAQTPVEITVTTERNDDVVLFYRGLMRFRFRNNGDNTYSARFDSGLFRGIQHLGVNALSNGTLFDDAAPYDSKAWILPFVVTPETLAQYVP